MQKVSHQWRSRQWNPPHPKRIRNPGQNNPRIPPPQTQRHIGQQPRQGLPVALLPQRRGEERRRGRANPPARLPHQRCEGVGRVASGKTGVYLPTFSASRTRAAPGTRREPAVRETWMAAVAATTDTSPHSALPTTRASPAGPGAARSTAPQWGEAARPRPPSTSGLRAAPWRPAAAPPCGGRCAAGRSAGTRPTSGSQAGLQARRSGTHGRRPVARGRSPPTAARPPPS